MHTEQHNFTKQTVTDPGFLEEFERRNLPGHSATASHGAPPKIIG